MQLGAKHHVATELSVISGEHVILSPCRQVRLKPYQIQRYPVTVADFLRYVNECKLPQYEWLLGLEEHRPMTCVTRGEARRYANHLGLRLPTEDEWEYAVYGYVNATIDTHLSQLVSEHWMRQSLTLNSDMPIEIPLIGKRPHHVSIHGLEDCLGVVDEWVEFRLGGRAWSKGCPCVMRVRHPSRRFDHFNRLGTMWTGFRCAATLQ